MAANSTRTLAVAAGAAVTVAAGVATYLILHRSVEEYGWEGTWRYIWEGDAYSEQVRRDVVDVLEEVEVGRSVQEARLHGMETALERARLDGVDDVDDGDDRRTSRDTVERWIVNYAPDGNLERTLGDVSDMLDRLAARVDGVVLPPAADDRDGSAGSQLMQQIRKRKKLLSKVLVNDMERCDALVASFQVLQEQS